MQNLTKIEKNKNYIGLVSFTQKIAEEAKSFEIKDAESEKRAIELRGSIQENIKAGESLRSFVINPYKKFIKSIDEKFYVIKDLKDAYKDLGDKMVAYQEKKEKEILKKKEQLLKKMKKDSDIEGAVKELEKVGDIDKTIESSGHKITYREHRTVVIEDEKKIPREYLMPDMVKIRKDILDGKNIPGVAIEVKKIPVQS